MREIKFRALLENETGRWWEYYTTLHEPVWNSPFFGAKIVVKDLQFTGLLDKNGRKIYEGDILKCSGHCDDNCVVYYAEMCACFIVLPYWKSYKDWCDDTEDDAGDYYLWDNIKLEIIGNIHENHELLEEQ